MVETAFGNLKKKYSRVKVAFDKNFLSGNGKDDSSTEKKRYDELKFFSWIEEFTQPRKTKTNIPVPTKRDLEVSSGESDGDEVETSEADTSAPSSVKSSAKKAKKVKEDPFMKRLDTIMSQSEKDEMDIYGQSVASDLRNMVKFDRMSCTHEINNIIYKYQMNSYMRESGSSTTSSSTNQIDTNAAMNFNPSWNFGNTNNL